MFERQNCTAQCVKPVTYRLLQHILQ